MVNQQWTFLNTHLYKQPILQLNSVELCPIEGFQDLYEGLWEVDVIGKSLEVAFESGSVLSFRCWWVTWHLVRLKYHVTWHLVRLKYHVTWHLVRLKYHVTWSSEAMAFSFKEGCHYHVMSMTSYDDITWYNMMTSHDIIWWHHMISYDVITWWHVCFLSDT